MAKRKSWRCVKQHRAYRVDEILRLLLVSKGTVRRWIKTDLAIAGSEKPYLIRGIDLITFLKNRSKKGGKCRLEEGWCFTCQKPKPAVSGQIEITLTNSKTGMMVGLCSTCAGLLYKRMSLSQIDDLKSIQSVTIKQAFENANLPYFHPHSFRHTLSGFGMRLSRTPEEFRAWSQNLSHEKVLTTLINYGKVSQQRQGEILNILKARQNNPQDSLQDGEITPELIKKVLSYLHEHQ